MSLADRLRSITDLLNEVPPLTDDAELQVIVYEQHNTINLLGTPDLLAGIGEHIGATFDRDYVLDSGRRVIIHRGQLDGDPVELTQHFPKRAYNECACGGRLSFDAGPGGTYSSCGSCGAQTRPAVTS